MIQEMYHALHKNIKAAVRSFLGVFQKIIQNTYLRKYITSQCSKLSVYRLVDYILCEDVGGGDL